MTFHDIARMLKRWGGKDVYSDNRLALCRCSKCGTLVRVYEHMVLCNVTNGCIRHIRWAKRIQRRVNATARVGLWIG